MIKKFCCPRCGSINVHSKTETTTHTTGQSFSLGQGCLGYLLLGPLGILCGLCGQGPKTTTKSNTHWECSNCGNRFKGPEELRHEIKSLNSSALAVSAVMCVIGLLIGIIVGVALADESGLAGFLAGAGTFALFAFIAFLVKGSVNSRVVDLEMEITELEESMNRLSYEAEKADKQKETEEAIRFSQSYYE